MKTSRRSRRMARHYRRSRKTPAFNIISLMDIFTILVFFLLVNTSEVEVLPNAKGIEMPESVTDVRPRESVVVMVTRDSIMLQGKQVASLDETMRSAGNDIQGLKQALNEEAQKRPVVEGAPPVREVTIMGDKKIPYNVLKKVMLSCTHAGFTKISLSVIQKAAQG